MLRTPIRLLASALFILSAGTAAAYDNGPAYLETCCTDDNKLRIWSRPTKDSSVVAGAVRNGEPVKNLRSCEKNDGHTWCQVNFRGQTGWVQKRFLRETDYKPHQVDGRPGGTRFFEIHGTRDNKLRIWSKPDNDSEVVAGGVRNGERVTDLGRCEKHDGERWCEVVYRGQRGWAMKKFLKEVGG